MIGKCLCSVDHWQHAALGLQGIVGMLNVLQSANVPCSPVALDTLEKFSGQLAEHVTRLRASQLSPGEQTKP